MLRGGGARRSPRRGAATASNRDEDKVSRANAPNQGTQLAGAKEAAPRVSDPEVAGGLVDAIRPMFPTLVGECQYPGFENEKTRLIECIYRVREDDVEGRERSRNDYNIGYTSFFSRTDLYNLPEFNPLAAFICGKGIEYAQFQKWDLQSFELRLISLWVNINPTYSYHSDHIHPFNHISGVFYVSCTPGCGRIVFRDPRVVRAMAPVPTSEATDINTDVVKIQPAEGLMLMFPAWLTHGVEQNVSEHDRVSVSFNLELQRRPGGPVSPRPA